MPANIAPLSPTIILIISPMNNHQIIAPQKLFFKDIPYDLIENLIISRVMILGVWLRLI